MVTFVKAWIDTAVRLHQQLCAQRQWLQLRKQFRFWSNTFTISNIFKKTQQIHSSTRGHAVAQLVEALRYKPKGRGFDSR
jgi:hypothetical protein